MGDESEKKKAGFPDKKVIGFFLGGGKSNLYKNWGQSFEAAKYNQNLNPEAGNWGLRGG
jgi:hypothetical protein